MTKKILLSALFFVLLFSSSSFAQTQDAPLKQAAIAQVNIDRAEVSNQVGNILNVSFTISNGDGVQTSVRYGMRLMTKAGKVVDEYVYDESLDLAQNSTTNKSVAYTPPQTLSGTYSLYVMSYNSQGFPLGIAYTKDIILVGAKTGVEIIQDTCSVSNAGTKSPVTQTTLVKANESLTLTCTAINKSTSLISALPQYETRNRSAYGDVVETTGGNMSAIDFKASEKKEFSLSLPKASLPGLYALSISLNADDQVSNKVTLMYSIEGSSAAILNVSSDKDYYNKKDTANINLFLAGSAATAEINLVSGSGIKCGSVDDIALSGSNNAISIPINRACFDPSIKVVLKDSAGTVLDQKTFDIKTTSIEAPKVDTKSALKILIVLLAIIIIYFFMKRRTMPKQIITVLIIGAFALIPFSKTHALNYPIGNDGVYLITNVQNLSNPGSTTYHQGDAIRVDAYIHNGSGITQSVKLSSFTVGNTPVDLFAPNSIVTVGSGQDAIGNTTTFIVSVPGPFPYYTEVAFTAAIDRVTSSQCVIDLDFTGSFRYGKINYNGPTSHPAFSVTVTLQGIVAPTPHTAPYDPSENRDIIFTIPANQQYSYYNGNNCGSANNGQGCGIEGPGGFDSGHISFVTPSTTYGGGRICYGAANYYYATCFIADTTIDLADGSVKNIQDVVIGDVLKGEKTNNKVLGFHQPTLGDKKLYSFNGGRYFVTAEHPFKTTEGWKSIDPSKTADENIGITVTELKVGDTIITDDGEMKLKTIDSKVGSYDTQLYNFILDGDHTYYADGYLVHNKTSCQYPNFPCGFSGGNPGICIDDYGTPLGTSPDIGSCTLWCTPGLPVSGGNCPHGGTLSCSSNGYKICN